MAGLLHSISPSGATGKPTGGKASGNKGGVMGVYGLQNRPPRSIVMTDAEVGELPGFAQDIIKQQRLLEAFCCAPIVDLAGARKHFSDRVFLKRSAHHMWKKVDGNAPRTR